MRMRQLHAQRDAGKEPAATHRHEHDVYVGQLRQDFEPDRALAGDDVGVVEWRDHSEAVLGLQLKSTMLPLERIEAAELDLGAIPTCCFDFGRHGVLWH